MGRLVIAAILLALLAPASAGATLPTDRPLTNVRATESLRIAAAFWGADLSCKPRLFAATGEQIEDATDTLGALEATPLGGCAIWMADDWLDFDGYAERIDFCNEVVHGYGHALGLYHSTEADTRSIMHAGREDNATVLPCYKRFLPKGRGREWRALRGGRPAWLGR